MKTKIIRLFFLFTLLSSGAFAQNQLTWPSSAWGEDQAVSMFSAIKQINWYYGNAMVTTNDVMTKSWLALNAAQIGYSFTSTQDFDTYVHNNTLTLIDQYFIKQATVVQGSNTVQNAVDAGHPLLGLHYNSTTGYSFVVIFGYDSAGYIYSDPVNGGSNYDTFGNFYDEHEITGVI